MYTQNTVILEEEKAMMISNKIVNYINITRASSSSSSILLFLIVIYK
jgi:hypothetical protein